MQFKYVLWYLNGVACVERISVGTALHWYGGVEWAFFVLWLYEVINIFHIRFFDIYCFEWKSINSRAHIKLHSRVNADMTAPRMSFKMISGQRTEFEFEGYTSFTVGKRPNGISQHQNDRFPPFLSKTNWFWNINCFYSQILKWVAEFKVQTASIWTVD